MKRTRTKPYEYNPSLLLFRGPCRNSLRVEVVLKTSLNTKMPRSDVSSSVDNVRKLS